MKLPIPVAPALLLALLFCGCAAPEPKNVVLVVVDTLRADRMSLYGYDRPTTPALEEFARTAVTFDRAYSPASWTRPSMASYFTGLYPSTHGCETKDDALDASHQTLAELFRDRGYATVGFHSNQNIGQVFGFGQGFDRYEKVPPNASYPGDHMVADADAVNELVLRWLREERPAEPWFLFVLYVDPHDPYLPHEEYWFGPEHDGEFHEGSRATLRKLNATTMAGQLREAATIRDLYDGEIAYVDSRLGELFQVLADEGLTDDTVVVVASDHGEGLWDHQGQRGHGRLLYEELIRVPLIVRWPGRSSGGARVSEPVHAFGLFGALAEAFDLDARHQAPSLMPYLDGRTPAEEIFVENRSTEADLRAWIDWPQKLILDDSAGRGELYDLVENPKEQGQRPAPRANLPARFLTAMDTLSAANAAWRAGTEFTSEPPQPSEEELEALRALGYID